MKKDEVHDHGTLLFRSGARMNLYPRGDLFLTELPGKIRIKPGSDCAMTAEDMKQHIRRGEAVQISGQWFRVSSEASETEKREKRKEGQAPSPLLLIC